jgi:hypothetical protein
MRPCRICAYSFGLALAAAVASAAGPDLPHAPVTIVLKFENPYSSRSVAEMKREFERATLDTMPVKWSMLDQVGGGVAGDLVLVTFKGRCIMDTVPPPLYDETGPLAWTSMVDGAPQPFGQVSCDRVRNSVLRAMWGGDFAHGDQLFGRALGRVLAHEFYHMLARTTVHGSSGVTKAALSGAQLISQSLTVNPEAIERMERHGQ